VLTMMLDGAAGLVVVGEAADGDQVAAALDAHPTNVVLMDLRMPGTNGIAGTRHVRARAHTPEVIVLITFDSDDNVLRALRAGRVVSCSRTPRPRSSPRPSAASPQVTRSSRRGSPAA
jgi:DNA-binding NarL/FixJ family response regulator